MKLLTIGMTVRSMASVALAMVLVGGQWYDLFTPTPNDEVYTYGISRPDAIFSDGVVVNQGMRYDVYKSKSAWPTHPGADSSEGRQGLVFAPLCCMVVLAYLCLYTPKACRSQRLMARLSCNGSSMEVNSAAPWPAYSGMVRHVEVENANIYRWDRRPNTHGKACAERHSACGGTRPPPHHCIQRHDTT